MHGSAEASLRLANLSNALALDEGTRKPRHYFDVYGAYLGSLALQPISILELGVYSGASLLIWREFFPNANIVGLDVRPAPERIQPLIERGEIHFVQGDQSSEDALRQCVALTATGRFDVIIDDASHIAALSRLSFQFLFPHGLRDRGLYFVEDYGTGYMPEFHDGAQFARTPQTSDAHVFPSHQWGMVGWMKQLIDELHGPYIMAEGANFLPIASIQFYPSIAVVRRL